MLSNIETNKLMIIIEGIQTEYNVHFHNGKWSCE